MGSDAYHFGTVNGDNAFDVFTPVTQNTAKIGS